MSLRHRFKRLTQLGVRWPQFMYEQVCEDGLHGLNSGFQKTGQYGFTGVSRTFVEEMYNPGTPIWRKTGMSFSSWMLAASISCER